MNKTSTALLACILLTSCVSFNTTLHPSMPAERAGVYVVPGVNKNNPQPYYDEEAVFRAGEARDPVLMCPPFVLPLLADPPPVPLEELSKITRKDAATLDNLQWKHIEDVRRHALLIKRAIKNAHDKYVEDCRNGAEAKKK